MVGLPFDEDVYCDRIDETNELVDPLPFVPAT